LEPDFDIAWKLHGVAYVGEVKSITSSNEERQLRLGLGQVLRYRNILSRQLRCQVRAVLIPERIPSDESWSRLCNELDVQLVAPPKFETLDLEHFRGDEGTATGRRE
jgi:hypothetical protein